MIIYKSTSGEGFNPLARVLIRLNMPVQLRSSSKSSRIIAVINIVISILWCLLIASWITGLVQPDLQSVALSAGALIVWQVTSRLALRRELFIVTSTKGPGTFQINLFTAEWFSFYMAMAFYLLYLSSLATHDLLDTAFRSLAGLSAAIMLIPLIQGSHAALINK